MLKPKTAFKKLTAPNPTESGKRAVILTLLFILLSVFSLSSLSGASAATGIVNTDNVNVRSGPATTYDALGRLNQGSQVEILGGQNGWYQIKASRLNGWIRNDLIDAQKEYSLEVTGSLVNLRSGPGTGFDIVGSVRKGEILALLAVKGEWYQVKTAAGLQAYIKASFTQKTEKPVPGSNTNPVSPPAAAAVKRVEVIAGTVFLRGGPGSGYDKTGSVSGGDILLVVGQEGDWYKIKKADGGSAYVAGWLVKPVNAAAPASPGNPTGAPTVILDGRQLNFDVPPIIESDRTLVPLRGIFEAMGASVDWDNNTRTVTSIKDGTTVILAIGSVRPTVNGQVWPLDVPAQIKNDRTLAPLRFVGEAFGGKVDWDNNTRTITITSPLPPAPAKPPEIKPALKPEKPNKPGAEAIWLSLATDEDGVRICMDSGAKLDADIKEESGKVTYEIKGRRIEGLNLVKQSLGVGEAKAKARNVGDNTIVVIEFPSSVQYRTASEEGGSREVFTIPNAVREIGQKNIGSSGERLIISTLTPAKYSSSKEGDTITINLPGVLKGEAKKKYQYGNTLMQSVAVEEATGINSATVIKITTSGAVAKHIVGQSTDGHDINILMVGKNRIKPRCDNLVVLDPGHGGKDDGCSGAYLKEKDINLKVALKAGELLKQRGIEVEYTRDTDIYLELTEDKDEISKIANRLNPALFVSIHVNAALNSSAQGTETYYYAPVDNDLLFLQQDERKSLAEKLQRQLIAKLKRPDRGIKTKNLAVLRNTTMPSALVELAFLSNPEEEELLRQEYFINLAAEAVADGISDYMGK